MIRSILVPLDGSPFGEYALPLAASIAREAPARLQLVRVHRPLSAVAAEGIFLLDDLDQSLRVEEKLYLDRVARRLRNEAGVSATATLLDGDVAAALEERATLSECDLVVLSTHGRGALGRFWLGSVADELIRRLPMPVLLVRPEEDPASSRNPPRFRRILVPLDGTPLAEQIIEPALAVGAPSEATFTLLRVVQPVPRYDYMPGGVTMEGVDALVVGQILAHQKQLCDESRQYLEGVAARLRSGGVAVETRVVVEDQPAVAILREALAGPSDLIALETHGRRGLSRLLMGSVADKVVRGGHLPVLLHRPAPGRP